MKPRRTFPFTFFVSRCRTAFSFPLPFQIPQAFEYLA